MMLFVPIFVSAVFFLLFFFFNDTATTEIYTLSLHDALPISASTWKNQNKRSIANEICPGGRRGGRTTDDPRVGHPGEHRDRKSTRLNSSHGYISYAVFCLKKKKKKITEGADTHLPRLRQQIE